MENEKDNAVVESTDSETTVESIETSTENTTNGDDQVDSKLVEDDGDDDFDFDDEGDTADDEVKETNTTPKKQSREENRKFAEQRRARKERMLKDSYYRGIKEAIGSINPFTNEKMESSEDVELYLTMKEMDAQGLDPTNTSDYLKFRAEKERQAEEAKLAQAKQIEQQNAQIRERANNDFVEFQKQFPNVNLSLMLKDENFKRDMQAFIAQGDSLSEAFKRCNNRRNTEVLKTAQEIAVKQAQTSSAKSPSMQDGDNSSAEPDWRKMPVGSKEFNDYVERKKRGL